MQTAEPGQPFTILRIKRKRTEEPLDALVVESRVRRKKSRSGIDVFQFAQTVERDAWEDEQQRQNLQAQISRLANVPPVQELATQVPPPNSRNPQPETEDSVRRYTVVENESDLQQRERVLRSPPKVLSAKELKARSEFKMYDAVPAEDNQSAAMTDPELEKFMPLLQEYLTISDNGTPSRVLPTAALGGSPSSRMTSSTSENDDYVWDVFYKRPATLSQWNSAANIGKLIGLPPSLDDSYDSDSDSEVEDEADEDSNAEEYYKNDYPDEEDSTDSEGSDIFHEDSDYDDVMHEDANDGHEWR